jgi:WD40 repeat protein
VSLFSLATKSPVKAKQLDQRVFRIWCDQRGEERRFCLLTEKSVLVLEAPTLRLVSTLDLKLPKDNHSFTDLALMGERRGKHEAAVAITGHRLISHPGGRLGHTLHYYENKPVFDAGPQGVCFATSDGRLVLVSEAGTPPKILSVAKHRLITAVAWRPDHGQELVCGDMAGRTSLVAVTVNGEFQVSPCHWHSMAVRAVAWASDGHHFYSGGGEAVLVKWSAKELSRVAVAPRLGDVIVSITASSAGHVAIALANHTVLVFTSGLELLAHFSLGLVTTLENVGGSSSRLSDSASFHWHRPSSSVMYQRGRAQLCLFDPRQKRDVAVLDVLDGNMVRGEREEAAEKKRQMVTPLAPFALSDGGLWTVTMEGCHVKIWEYVEQSKEFRIDARLVRAHDLNIIGASINETSIDGDALLVTRGNDAKIKLWCKSNPEGWYFAGEVTYKSRRPVAHALSEDLSVLAVAHEEGSVSFWGTQSLNLRTSSFIGSVKALAFGKRERGHLLFCLSSGQDGENSAAIMAWDCIQSQITGRLIVPAESALRCSLTGRLMLFGVNGRLSEVIGACQELRMVNEANEDLPDFVDIFADNSDNFFVVHSDGQVSTLGQKINQDTDNDQIWQEPTDKSVLAGALLRSKQGNALTAAARDEGRWSIDDVEVTKPLAEGLESLLKLSL